MLDLTDRSHCFYWQTDRDLSPEDFKTYFLQRHEVDISKLENILRDGITSLGAITELSILSPDENVIKGNVNIVRKVRINGKIYVVRMHPSGIKNGYFYVEREVLERVNAANLPAPRILEIHEAIDENDMDFVLMTESPGITMQLAIEKQPDLEIALLEDAGRKLAKVHEIAVEGFGPFNNKIAKNERKLQGLHPDYNSFVHCGLEENLERLIKLDVINVQQAKKFGKIFEELSFEPLDGPKVIHNDYADWNLLAVGNEVSAMLDWDECHAGDPIADLACWSTFYDIERYGPFLRGYTEVAALPEDYEFRFHFYRLRYTISKMALRVKRRLVDDSPFILDKIKVGQEALAQEEEWFKKR